MRNRELMLKHSRILHELEKEAHELESLAGADKSNLLWITTFSFNNNRWAGSPIVLERLREHLRELMAERVKEIDAEIGRVIALIAEE